MRICVAIIYHPSEEKQAQVLCDYYRTMLPTFTFACDFLQKSEHEFRNEILDSLKDDFDRIVFLDSDEVFTRRGLTEIVEALKSAPPEISVIRTRIQYYLSPLTVQDPQPPYCPCVALDPARVHYADKRNLMGTGRPFDINVDLHHLYYQNRKWKLDQFKKRNILGNGQNGTEDEGLLNLPSRKMEVPEEVKLIQEGWESCGS